MIAGTVLMCVCMEYANHLSYRFPVWKIVVSAVLSAGIGLLGAKLMAWIEIGSWAGRSYFGALFLAPLLLWPVSKALNVRFGSLMDLSAPEECVMVALLKVKCKIDGCCYGRLFDAPHGAIQFPSQIVEAVAALLLLAVLFVLIKRRKHDGEIFPIYMILYGAVRFVLNLFRETTPWIGPLPAGNFWSLVSIVLGIAAILRIRKRRSRTAGTQPA